MFKSIVYAAATSTLLILCQPANAGERPAAATDGVSRLVLTDLGLAGLQPINDRQGQQIRGRAFEGTPGNGPFTTLPTVLRKDGLGVIEHGFIKGTQTTTIVNQPQLGTITLPPQLKK